MLGWEKTTIYQKRRWPHLKLIVVAQMAKALGVPVGKFCEEVALEEGIPKIGERVLDKPNLQITNLERREQKLHTKPFRRCTYCSEPGHDRQTCPKRTQPSPELELQHEMAKASPKRRRTKRRTSSASTPRNR